MQLQKAVLDSLFLFNQSKHHREYTIAQFNQELVFPVLHEKIRIYYEHDKPVSLVTWCWFSEEQAALFVENKFYPTEDDYSRSRGDQLWGLHFIAPFGHSRQTMRQTRKFITGLYGKNTTARWPRLHTPNKVVRRIL